MTVKLNPSLPPWRITPGVPDDTYRKTAKEVDASPVGNKDGEVSLSEVDAFIAAEKSRLAELSAGHPAGYSNAEMGAAKWNIMSAEYIRGVLVEKADTWVIKDLGEAIAVRSLNALLGPFFKGLDIPS